MNIEEMKAEPVKDSIIPEICIKTKIKIHKGYEIPINIIGDLLSGGKKIADINGLVREGFSGPQEKIELIADVSKKDEYITLIRKSIVPLNNRTLDHITELRSTNKKRQVILSFKGFIRVLQSKVMCGKMELVHHERKTMEDVFYGSNLIEIIDVPQEIQITINADDWLYDFCPELQIGKFLTIEYPQLDPMSDPTPGYGPGHDSIEKILNSSIDSIKKMQEDINKSEWNRVIEDSRGVVELFNKKKDMIKDLLDRDGYTVQAITELELSIRNLFDLSSKFHHKTDLSNNKVIMPDIKANIEDAFLIYSMSIGLVSLVTKKLKRFK